MEAEEEHLALSRSLWWMGEAGLTCHPLWSENRLADGRNSFLSPSIQCEICFLTLPAILGTCYWSFPCLLPASAQHLPLLQTCNINAFQSVSHLSAESTEQHSPFTEWDSVTYLNIRRADRGLGKNQDLLSLVLGLNCKALFWTPKLYSVTPQYYRIE